MNNKFKKLISAIVWILPIVFLCGVSFYAGAKLNSTIPNGKYLIADKSSVIFNAVFDHPGMTDEERKKSILDPIVSILKKYSDMGYVIIEAGKDERGMHVISALPATTRDITEELLMATKQKGEKNVDADNNEKFK